MAEFNYQYEEPKKSKLPLISLGARIVTLVSLVASIIILKNDKVVYKLNSQKYRFSYSDSSSYQYVLFSMVVGFAYTFFQIPFEIYFLVTGKSLIKHHAFSLYNVFGDKLGLTLLGTSLGAIYGTTLEIKRYSNYLETIGGFDAADYRSKMDNFSGTAYFSAVFLLVGFISAAISSVISTLALSKPKE